MRVLMLARQSYYRYLVEKVCKAGEPMAGRAAWRICTQNRWLSVLGRSVAGMARLARLCTMIVSSATTPPVVRISCASAISLRTAQMKASFKNEAIMTATMARQAA